MTLGFVLSWLVPFTGLQAWRGAWRHYMFLVECVTSLALSYEVYRECLILFFAAEMPVSPLRVWMYGTEHVFLGLVIREVLLYAEQRKNTRMRRCQIH